MTRVNCLVLTMVPAMIYAKCKHDAFTVSFSFFSVSCIDWPSLRPQFILKTGPRTLPGIYIFRLFACENTSYLKFK